MNKITKYLKNQASVRNFFVTGLLVFMVIATCFTLTAAAAREITILDSGASVTLRTTKNTVGEVIDEAGITLHEYDIVSVDLNTSVNDADVVEIKRAKDIEIKDANHNSYTVRSAYETADEILAQYNINVGEFDEVTFDGSKITIVRVTVNPQTVSEVISFETVYENDSDMYLGTQKIVTAGVNGSEDVVYHDIYKNGEFFERSRNSSTVTVQPVNQVVKVGIKEYAAAPASYKKVITCKATAYDGSYATLGYYNPRTALGAVPTVGTVAVDPRVIPLGTKLYIASTDGSYIYGYCFAGDTGGAIKGNRVDLFMGSRREALNFGARQVNVFILE